MRWLAANPFRIFFITGALFSIVGVCLWPLFYTGWLLHYPGPSHARIMVECFGGGFMLGLLGSIEPPTGSASRSMFWRAGLPLLLQFACGAAHLNNRNDLGDVLFVIFVVASYWSLHEKVLYLPGQLCGICGAILHLSPLSNDSPAVHRLADLLLYQGFLLCPILTVGITFGRRHLLGTGQSNRRSGLIATGLVVGIVVEAFCLPVVGIALRMVAVLLACSGLWKSRPAGTLSRALVVFCFPFILAGITAPAASYAHHVPLNHLLFIGGYGLFALLITTALLCEGTGESNIFIKRSRMARWVAGLVIVAALTRASADFSPRILVSHLLYASLLWTVAVILWMVWHRRRLFFKADAPEPIAFRTWTK